MVRIFHLLQNEFGTLKIVKYHNILIETLIKNIQDGNWMDIEQLYFDLLYPPRRRATMKSRRIKFLRSSPFQQYVRSKTQKKLELSRSYSIDLVLITTHQA